MTDINFDVKGFTYKTNITDFCPENKKGCENKYIKSEYHFGVCMIGQINMFYSDLYRFDSTIRTMNFQYTPTGLTFYTNKTIKKKTEKFCSDIWKHLKIIKEDNSLPDNELISSTTKYYDLKDEPMTEIYFIIKEIVSEVYHLMVMKYSIADQLSIEKTEWKTHSGFASKDQMPISFIFIHKELIIGYGKKRYGELFKFNSNFSGVQVCLD